MKTQGKRLTARQKRFIAEYRKDYNGAQAAIRAGYSPKNANDQAAQLLSIPQLKEILRRETEDTLKKIGIHAEALLRDRARVAKCDPRRFFNPDGTVKPPQEWDDEMAGAVAGFEVVETFSGQGENRKLSGYIKKLKLNDRNPAQHDLMDHAELFPERSAKPGLEVHGDVNLTNIELSARAIYLIKLALERKKAAEEQGQIGTRGNEEL